MPQALSEADFVSHVRSPPSEAVLTEAVRHVDIVHTSLAGMTAIVVTLLSAVALPIFGYPSVTQPFALVIMAVAAFTGIGGLYYLNFRAHEHVAEQARLTEVLVNSLGQGFLVFGRDGMCGKVYSQACIDLLECVPSGKHVADVLRVPAAQRADFQDWLDVLYQPEHALGFDDVVKFLPQYFSHSRARRVHLIYRPITRRDGALINVVVIATDQTEQYEAQQLARKKQDFAEMICCIFRERNQFRMTLAQLRAFLDAADKSAADLNSSTAMLRQLHTLKAAVRQFNLIELGDVISNVENELRAPSVADCDKFHVALLEGRRKIAEALRHITEDIGDLIGDDNQEMRGNVREINESDLYSFAHEMKKREIDPELIRRYLVAVVAVPVRDCLHAFDRGLRDLSGVVDKQVRPVRFIGENPVVLQPLLHDFFFSLTHLSRNIMDHGIETPVTRMARGKDPAGLVTVKTEILQLGGRDWLRIVISDDGNGIDPSRVRSKMSLLDPEGLWRFEDDQTVIQRIFSWGFTTSEVVTTLSGRGVGLEVIKQEVVKLGGSIHVDSELYKGASFDIRIPYRVDANQLDGIVIDGGARAKL